MPNDLSFTKLSKNVHDMPTYRTPMKIFFLLDTSGSMSKRCEGGKGTAISSLNQLMTELAAALKDLDKQTIDFHVQIAVLEYNNDAQWVTVDDGMPGVEDIQFYQHKPLTAHGYTNLSKALSALNTALSSSANGGFMVRDRGSNYMPIFVFISDGVPLDEGEWEPELEKLKQNGWYAKHKERPVKDEEGNITGYEDPTAIKLGFLLARPDSDVRKAEDVMIELVGNKEKVLTFNDLETFMKSIKEKVLASTIINGHTTPVNPEPKPEPEPQPDPKPEPDPILPLPIPGPEDLVPFNPFDTSGSSDAPQNNWSN